MVYPGGIDGIPWGFIVWLFAGMGRSKLITVSIFSVASNTALFLSIKFVCF